MAHRPEYLAGSCWSESLLRLFGCLLLCPPIIVFLLQGGRAGIGTAKENGLDPFRYLAYLFEQLPAIDRNNAEALDSLLPGTLPVQAVCAIYGG